MTDSEARALDILAAHGPMMPREFAKAMWPDSRFWQVSYNCGPNGSHRGGAMYRSGGAYLGRLRRKGWVENSRHRYYYTEMRLTGAGQLALSEHQRRAA